MAGTARLFCLQGQSVMNGRGVVSDAVSSVPNQSLSYHGWNLRDPYIDAWVASTVYSVGNIRHNGGNEYECITPGTSAGSGGPTTTAADITDGGAHWKYLRVAQADVPVWQATTGYLVGDVVRNGSTQRFYICILTGISAASGGPTTTAVDILDNTCRWKFHNTSTLTTRKLNRIYQNGAKIWNPDLDRFQSLSLAVSTTRGEDADGVLLQVGPQTAFAAHILNRWNDEHSFIVKHAVDGRPLGYINTLGNYSIQQYDVGGGNAYLRTFMDSIKAAMDDLLGITVADWATATIYAHRDIRKNGGNVYQCLYGGTSASAPTGTGQSITDGTAIWRWLRTVYDDVQIVALAQEHGAQDTNYNVWAYQYYFNEMNLWRRFHHRLNFADGNGVFVGYVEPFVPRNQEDAVGGAFKIAFADIIRTDIKMALNDYATLHEGAAVTPTVRANDTLYGDRAAFINSYDLYTAPYYDRATDDLHYTCAGTETMVDRWFAAFDAAAPTAQTWGETETTSFYGGGSRPTLVENAAPAASYAPGASVTASVTASLNGASNAGIEWYWDHDTAAVVSTGLSCTNTPAKYNGHVLRARCRDTNGYWASYFKFVNILAPRTALTNYCTANGVTIKHWMRSGLNAAGTNLAANGSVDNVLNFTGATANYAVRASGVTAANLHHDGIAMQKLDALRFNSDTSDDATSQQAANLLTSGNTNFTRFFKGRLGWRANDVTGLYGAAYFNAASGVNGGGISLEASAAGADGDGTDFRLSGRYANGLSSALVTSGGDGNLVSTDVYNAGQDIVVAEIKNASGWQLRWVNPDGSIGSKVVSGATSIANNGYPDVIGWQSSTVTGMEGVVNEVIGIEHAITDNAVVDSILLQLAANEPMIANATDVVSSAGTLASANRELRIRLQNGGGTTYITRQFYQQFGFAANAQGVAAATAGLTVGADAFAAGAADVVTASGTLEAPTIDLGAGAASVATATAVMANKEVRIRLQNGNGASYYTNQIFQNSSMAANIAADVVTATGDLTTSKPLFANAANVSTAAATLEIPTIDLSAGASDVTSSTANLTAYRQTILAAPLYTGTGSICDPKYWTDPQPAAGWIATYPDVDGLTISPNGEVNATVDSGQYAISVFDGATTYPILFVLSPFSADAAAQASATGGLSGIAADFDADAVGIVAASGDLTTSKPLFADAQVVVDATANLSVTAALASGAETVVGATGNLSVGVSMDADAQVVIESTADMSVGSDLLSADAQVVVDATGDLAVGADMLSADAAVVTDSTADLSVSADAMAADAAMAVDSSATFEAVADQLTGDAIAESDSTANLTVAARFNADAQTEVVADGNLQVGIGFATTAVSEASTSANLTSGSIFGANSARLVLLKKKQRIVNLVAA